MAEDTRSGAISERSVVPILILILICAHIRKEIQIITLNAITAVILENNSM